MMFVFIVSIFIFSISPSLQHAEQEQDYHTVRVCLNLDGMAQSLHSEHALNPIPQIREPLNKH